MHSILNGGEGKRLGRDLTYAVDATRCRDAVDISPRAVLERAVQHARVYSVTKDQASPTGDRLPSLPQKPNWYPERTYTWHLRQIFGSLRREAPARDAPRGNS